MDDLLAAREQLSRQLAQAISTDPIGALSTIATLQVETDEHLRHAVAAAAGNSSWREIADALGVSKQAAHQRFRTYAHAVAREMKTEQIAMKQALRDGDTDQAARARVRRRELAEHLRTSARTLKDQGEL